MELSETCWLLSMITDFFTIHNFSNVRYFWLDRYQEVQLQNCYRSTKIRLGLCEAIMKHSSVGTTAILEMPCKLGLASQINTQIRGGGRHFSSSPFLLHFPNMLGLVLPYFYNNGASWREVRHVLFPSFYHLSTMGQNNTISIDYQFGYNARSRWHNS